MGGSLFDLDCHVGNELLKFWVMYTWYIVLHWLTPFTPSIIFVPVKLTLQGAVSIWICHLTNIAISMLKIRRTYNCLIFNMGIQYQERWSLYWGGTRISYLYGTWRQKLLSKHLMISHHQRAQCWLQIYIYVYGTNILSSLCLLMS